MDLKAQDFRKSAEAVSVYKEIVKAYMDYSLNEQAVAQKHDDLATQFNKLLTEAKAVEDKADKIEQDHKDKFKP